jgi:hypothetical protein
MPLIALQHPSHKGRAFVRAWLALAADAGHNRSANTDAQVRPAAARRLSLGAGYFQRYVARRCSPRLL